MCLTLYDIMSTRDVFFYPRCPLFYFFLSIRNAFSHPMYHMLYIIRTTCDVFLCPMCLMFCFVLSIGIAFSSDVLYVLYCHIHSGSVLLTHVSYVLCCLWPFGYHSPSDVSYDLYFHLNQWCPLSSYVLFCLVVYDRFPPSDVSYFLYCHIHLEFGLLSYVSKVYFLSTPFGLRSSTRCIVCFILPCPPVMCYFILCVFSSLTLFFTRCVIGFIFSFYQGCVLLSYAFFVCFIRNAFPLPMCHIPHDVISIGMCSFILCVICFTLSFGLRSFIRYGISFLLSGPPGICFYLVWTMFYFVFSIRKAFYHPICHMLYIVNSTCDVTFHAMVPGFYFIRCVICFILSCTPYVLFYPTWCSMFYFTLSIRIAIFIRCVTMCHHVMSIRDMLFYSMYYVFRLFCPSPDL
jgi:hypothetical protein